MTGMAKAIQSLPPARQEEEISDLYNLITDTVAVMVQMGPESRSLIRDFLEGLDENLTVADVKAALEAEWA
ncbi:hypothetical protein D3W54_06915 [Komagataeibacter medellinensis]|uniref:Uncharacterized protein n=2 Tax=Komagataeibacter medellinensis TaxID=1177712 RepID=A0ABQ6VXX7_9PROT|nr:hypothetical protein D3W54_06915 [Komagataeibacter medellinensis]